MHDQTKKKTTIIQIAESDPSSGKQVLFEDKLNFMFCFLGGTVYTTLTIMFYIKEKSITKQESDKLAQNFFN